MVNLNIMEYSFNIVCMWKFIGCDVDIIVSVWEIDRIINWNLSIFVFFSESLKVVFFFFDRYRVNYCIVGSNLVSYVNRGIFSFFYDCLMDKFIIFKKIYNWGGRGIISFNDYFCIVIICIFNICEYKVIFIVVNWIGYCS